MNSETRYAGTIEARYYDNSLRQNVIYKRGHFSAPSVLEAVKFCAGDDHSDIERYPSQDSNGWLCFISNLNHTFMVEVPARQF